MGFFSDVWGGAKRIVKGATKIVEDIGKGVSKVVGKVSSALGLDKLGPLGSIALSFMIPAAWGALGNTAFGGTAFYQGVNSAVSSVNSVVGNFFKPLTDGASKTFSSISDSFSTAFESIGGGSVEQGATKAFDGGITGAWDEGNLMSTATDTSVSAASKVGQASEFLGVNPEQAKMLLEQNQGFGGEGLLQTKSALDTVAVSPDTLAYMKATGAGTEQSQILAEQTADFGAEGLEMTKQAAAGGTPEYLAATPWYKRPLSDLGSSLLSSAGTQGAAALPSVTEPGKGDRSLNGVGASKGTGAGAFDVEAMKKLGIITPEQFALMSKQSFGFA